jgi:hypothetical protein
MRGGIVGPVRLFLCSAALSCGGAPADGGPADHLGVSIESALEKDCPKGGVIINQGIDSNGNGQLDADEVTSSETVCHGSDGADGANGSSCSVTDNGDGTKTISCTDGTTATVADGADGTDGANGANGTAGTDGSSCSVTDNGDGTKTISCTDGTTATVADGTDGTNGTNGADGSSCSVTDNGDGTKTISCTDGTTATVSDGSDGTNGTDGTDNRIIATIGCSGQIGSTGVWADYDVRLMASGDIWSDACIRSYSAGMCNSSYYAAGQVGAATAPVLVLYDLSGTANAGWWKIYLDRTTLITTLEYNDADEPGGQSIWYWVASQCVLTSYP